MSYEILLKDLAYKLRKIRESKKLSCQGMASYIGVSRVTYARYEKEEYFPSFIGLYSLGKETGISLDWLICSRGPMDAIETETKAEQPGNKGQVVSAPQVEAIADEESREPLSQDSIEVADQEMRDMVKDMQQIPIFRHEILGLYYRLKKEYKD